LSSTTSQTPPTNAGADPSKNRFRKVPDFGNVATTCFDLERIVRSLYFKDDGDGSIQAIPVCIVDPCQGGVPPLFTASLTQSGLETFTQANPTSKFSATFVCQVRHANTPAATVAGQVLAPVVDLQRVSIRVTSALNAANTLIIDTKGLSKTLAINVSVSAGAPTFAVSVSADNVTFITIDTALAVGPKQYVEATLGATTALSPLSFQYLKIVVGAAGVGNTSTIDLGMK
jgi:hypothetical protein